MMRGSTRVVWGSVIVDQSARVGGAVGSALLSIRWNCHSLLNAISSADAGEATASNNGSAPQRS